MPSENAVAVRRRKQRVGVACDFCRRRKLGCDGTKPKCENCQLHGKDCIYSERIQRERPSNSRINQLEEENARLRRSLTALRSQSNFEQSQANSDADILGYEDHPASTPPVQETASEPVCEQTMPPDGRITSYEGRPENTPTIQRTSPTPLRGQAARFHGPSSALFDRESPHKRRKTGRPSVDPQERTQVLAASSRQRMAELINSKTGKLDFDGLEPNVGMQLLSIFWNRQHYSGSVVYRTCFMRDMECQGPYYSRLLLNAILFVATKHAPSEARRCQPPTHNTADGMHFRQKVEEMLYRPDTQLLCTSSITTVQALLLMSDALFSWCDERSLSWHYLGIAISMIIDLGMHTENPKLLRDRSPEDLEVHRRVFWAAFVLDKAQSIYQGRPARLREMDNQVPIMFLDEYDELEPFHTLTYSATPSQTGYPTHGVSTFEHLVKLCIVADRILSQLYSENCSSRDPQELYRSSYSLYTDLKEWRESLPDHLAPRWGDLTNFPVLPHTLSLLSMYHSLLILLHRPFVSDGHLQSVARFAARDSFVACATAAAEIDSILRLYRKHYCMSTCPYFLSYATYVSGTIHVRIAAQRSPDSRAHQRLRNCLEVLSENQIQCHGPRQSMAILLGLVRWLKVDVGKSFTAFSSRTSELEDLEHANGEVNLDSVESGTHTLDHSRNGSAPEFDCSDELQIDFATPSTGVDIETIMQTFDPAPYMATDRDNSQAAGASFPLDGGADEFFIFDPLFGLDTSMIGMGSAFTLDRE